MRASTVGPHDVGAVVELAFAQPVERLLDVAGLLDEVADRLFLEVARRRPELVGERGRRAVHAHVEVHDSNGFAVGDLVHQPLSRPIEIAVPDPLGQVVREPGPQRPGRVPAFRLRDRGADAQGHRDDEVAIFDRVRPPGRVARCEHRPADHAGAHDRRAHHAVEAGRGQRLVELRPDLRAHFALRHLRHEHRLAGFGRAARVQRFVGIAEPQHRTHRDRALRIAVIECRQPQRAVGFAQAHGDRVTDDGRERLRGALVHRGGVHGGARHHLLELVQHVRHRIARVGLGAFGDLDLGHALHRRRAALGSATARHRRSRSPRRPSPRRVARCEPTGTRSGSARRAGAQQS